MPVQAMAPILALFILVTIVTGLTRRGYQDEESSGSGSGRDDESGDGPEPNVESETTVATHIGLNATDENFFTPTLEYPPEAYTPPDGPGDPLVNPEDGFYINSDGSGDPDDDGELQEVDLLVKAFDMIHPFE
ncbi:protein E30 [Elephant endotheliotropic herpesvirus 6]|nr:protein E30 [Elephant endotheliotropic herpesvirus 6]